MATACRVHTQIAKLLIAPFVCVIEMFYMGKTFGPLVLASMGFVVAGVAIVTVSGTLHNAYKPGSCTLILLCTCTLPTCAQWHGMTALVSGGPCQQHLQ
jgi:drug/metabolite transporter (DMT)-like permease